MSSPFISVSRALAAASPIAIAKKALKTARKANRRSNPALLRATRGPADASITSAKIANLTIQGQDIGDGQITFAKIADGTIGTNKLGDGSVGTAKLANGAVTTAKLAGADLTGTIHGAAGAIAAHSCVTAAIAMGGARVGDVALLTFIGNTPVPQA